MEVKAEERWCAKEYDLQSVTSWDEVKNACMVIGNEDWIEVVNWLEAYIDKHRDQFVLYIDEDDGKLVVARWRGRFDVSSVDMERNSIEALKITAVSWNSSCYILQKEIVSSKTDGDINNTSDPSHTHSYSWMTVEEATDGQDGIEEYRCSCGDVQGRSVIPASVVFVKGFYSAVKDAPQNGTASFDSGRLYTLSDYVIRKLAERTDVTTVITFEYQNQAYKMTIPAGADYTQLLMDEDYFYGYFYFANSVGATIEAL